MMTITVLNRAWILQRPSDGELVMIINLSAINWPMTKAVGVIIIVIKLVMTMKALI